MSWLSHLLHKSRSENHLDKELRFHMDQQIADNVAAGMSPEEARRRATLEFGGLERVKEEVRETSVTPSATFAKTAALPSSPSSRLPLESARPRRSSALSIAFSSHRSRIKMSIVWPPSASTSQAIRMKTIAPTLPLQSSSTLSSKTMYSRT